MATGDETAGAVRDGPERVQGAWLTVFVLSFSLTSVKKIILSWVVQIY
jgi:hypothetical protein